MYMMTTEFESLQHAAKQTVPVALYENEHVRQYNLLGDWPFTCSKSTMNIPEQCVKYTKC